MNVSHWYRDGDVSFIHYPEDSQFYDLYEEEMWHTIPVQVTPEEVTVFIDGDEFVVFSNSANCIGENGRIGLRGGSKGGWDIKNLKVYEGLYTEEETTPTPEATQTPVPTEPSATPESTPSGTPTETTDGGNGGNNVWKWIAGLLTTAVIVIVVACAGIMIAVIGIVLKKKKK